MNASNIDLATLFSLDRLADGQSITSTPNFARTRVQVDGADALIDTFAAVGARCAFLRAGPGRATRLMLPGNHRIASSAAGGWLLKPVGNSGDVFWIPQAPRLRRLDSDGHILAHSVAEMSGVDVAEDLLAVQIEVPDALMLDLTIWQLPPDHPDIIAGLESLHATEGRPVFLWSSHTRFVRPADTYLHLVHGHVYENHEVWPKYWRVCSELDAYAMYVASTGLWRATGKLFYDLLRRQLVLSVIARQAQDGGWHHGEWTNDMESHYRLHAAAMHMLAAYVRECPDPVATSALRNAAAFAAVRIDRLDVGPWYLHDSLEQDETTIRKSPFRRQDSRALGKSISNLLVLNTHLDTNIAMEHARLATGDDTHLALISAAHETSEAICAMRPAEWLYRPLFCAINLTLLPSRRGAALPLPLRALKRIAWKYLVPQLPRIKAIFPRLVMPGGFIERDLSQRSFSVRYQPVNLMDLARTRKLFSDARLDPLLDECFAFTQHAGIRERWKELKGKEDDSLGFWAEALYHLCLVRSDRCFRQWLAESMMDLADAGIGLSPSLLGGNAEAVPPDMQTPCPAPADRRLATANLSTGPDSLEWLVVNPGKSALTLRWGSPVPANELVWQASSGPVETDHDGFLIVPARGWLHAFSAPAVQASP